MRKLSIGLVLAIALMLVVAFLAIAQDAGVGQFQPFSINIQHEEPVTVTSTTTTAAGEVVTVTTPITLSVDLRINVTGPDVVDVISDGATASSIELVAVKPELLISALDTGTMTDKERIFWERYRAQLDARSALEVRMESLHPEDPAWRAKVEELAQAWDDTLSVMRGTAIPDGDKWDEPGNMIDWAMIHYGSAASAIMGAMNSNNPSRLRDARSYIIRADTEIGDAMRLLDKE